MRDTNRGIFNYVQRCIDWSGPSLCWHCFVEHLELDDGEMIFEHACQHGCEDIVSKRLGSRYVSGRTRDWIKVKNPNAPAAKREAEEDWRR
jgi:hypothetical protein